MADEAYYLSKQDVDDLKVVLAVELRKLSNKRPYTEAPIGVPSPDVYLAMPPCGQGIAARVADIPGSAYCCLFHLEPTNIANTSGGFSIVPLMDPIDPDNRHMRRRVWNFNTDAVPALYPPAEKYIQIARDKHGQWWVADIYEAPEASTTSTTTIEPGIDSADCECTWEWLTDHWVLSNEDCCQGAADATTTTPDPNPCTCPTREDENSTTSTTTTTATETSTTTVEPEWKCAYPLFCGTTNGDCTRTRCAHNEEDPDIECTTTGPPPTTTTLDPEIPTTTSTTVDCNTTTTTLDIEYEDPGGGCNGGCDWLTDPVGLYWYATSGCGFNADDCGANTCGGCASPAVPPDICDTASTPCVTYPTVPPAVPAPGCRGGASFICGSDNAWHMISYSDCTGCGTPYKGCPSCAGDYNWGCSGCSLNSGSLSDSCDGKCGQYTSIGCAAAKPPTVDCGDGNGSSSTYDPCEGTTITETSTTTADPCGTVCEWETDETLLWIPTSTGCEGDCNCPQPLGDPVQTCEKAITKCISIDPPTTTVPPSTTSTTGTTTTTTTTTTEEPWYCDGMEDFNCDTGTCVQGPAEFECGGPYATEAACLSGAAPCATTTTTTTVEPNWWCCGNPCSAQNTKHCVQGINCGGGVETCGGPHVSEAVCEENCDPGTTTSSTTTATTTTTTCECDEPGSTCSFGQALDNRWYETTPCTGGLAGGCKCYACYLGAWISHGDFWSVSNGVGILTGICEYCTEPPDPPHACTTPAP